MSANIDDFQRLQYQVNQLERMNNGLQRTIDNLTNLPQFKAGEHVISSTKLQQMRNILATSRQELVGKDQMIDALKTNFRTQLLSVKKDLLLPYAVASGPEFRDAVRTSLIQIKQEVEKCAQENEILRKQASSSSSQDSYV